MISVLFFSVLLRSSYAFGASSPAAPDSSVSSIPTASGIANPSSPSVADYLKFSQKEHDAQYEAGAAVFGVSSEDDDAAEQKISYTDDDFIPHDIGVGNGGPSESMLRNGHIVYQTVSPVLSPEECDYWIQTARGAIAAGRAAEAASTEPKQRSRFSDRTNAELGEARLSVLPPEAVAKLKSLLKNRLYPMLESRFGVTDLTVYDGLILGSIAPAISQPVHRDASLLTLNIALSPSDGYTEGGTYIEGLEGGLPLRAERGVALCHSSGVMHAGNGIQTGERWQMVLFCLAKDEPQVARRCHAVGLDAIADGDLEGAKDAFESGLTVAPRDHLLHMGRGQVNSARGDQKGAFNCLDLAADCYPLSPTAGIAMGKMHLAARRPRAALRRLDVALSNIGDKDLKDGAWMPLKAAAWDARVTAARCALLCAEFEATRDGPREWTRERLPEAIDRIKTSIAAAPQDDRLYGLLSRAEELLNEAEVKSQ